MSELTTVARPYAKAAFDFALQQGALDKWAEMLSFAASVAKDDRMASFLSSSATVGRTSEVFIGVCGDALTEQAQNLIKVMAENERLTALPAVLEQFNVLRADYEKEIVVDVTGAVEMSDAQKTELSKALEARLQRKIKLNCSVDASMIGGLTIQAGDTVIDGSLRGKLERLAYALQS
ncbi:ATP synthase F1 subcomplex delta subunit [Idiomarina fontislapidosi]|uniref:ATP synthase subunit delta n=1 Tax=Idiomarina fontislapidosi TaxID=263723 RepID=A0A432XP42_9GAMM|nr:F0F1 ATP synthase subunit delta [Idiomarina fontislapidosi]PYE30586.1 ATP synthase F1 subcomplex delta subunit [Idiomarina fontislapidosi]RUO50479.1 F0F1 ATP synthase subunit delta [Idiomarina fontislapidosi]